MTVWFALGLLVVAAATAAVARTFRIPIGWQPVVALARAALQLTIIALLLKGVLSAPATAAAFIALMLLTASTVAGGRIRAVPHGRRHAATGVVVGAGVALGTALALHLVPLDARHVIALSSIVIGNAMSASTLAGRRFAQDAAARRGEVEGWLALGATPRRAYDDILRAAVAESLLPNLDQTRATGLVTLPGAFVGALFAGAPPAEAARFQLVVLASIGLAMLVTALVVTLQAARSPHVFVE
ncbi:ABC transporter permease [Nocardioides jiangxiensis]|uniref:ABC transporter permease n=1 Tax=Nocardioides jiangxiensis TaxID=3064524 RepID=A0ABT9AXH5_9ACTN|nr:ABC transporter permease [Nocardioides sp. WY-20]MDO7867070.1 ABC transporter permease [Nocardioides sp. WY-20]